MTTIDFDTGGRQRRTDDRRMGYDRRGSLVGWTAPQGDSDGRDFSDKQFHLRSFDKRRQADERRRETRSDASAAPGGPGFLRISDDGIRPHPALPPALVAAINNIIADCRDRVLARHERTNKERTSKADQAEAKVWQMVDYCVALNSVIKAAVDHHGPNRDHIASALHAASQALFPDPKLAHAAFTSALKETARLHGNLDWSSIHETMGRA